MLYFYILLLGLLWLATSRFVSGGCACYLSFLFLSLGGSENLKQEGAEGAERLHPCRQTKNATEDASNLHTHACKQMKTICHTCLQASLHKHKTAGNKERQQEN